MGRPGQPLGRGEDAGGPSEADGGLEVLGGRGSRGDLGVQALEEGSDARPAGVEEGVELVGDPWLDWVVAAADQAWR